MQLSLNIMSSHVWSRFAVAATMMSIASAANAGESAYIQQAAPGAATKPAVLVPIISESTGFPRSNAQVSLTPPPEQLSPRGASATNFAQTIEVGNNNSVAQLQAGRHDASSVSVLGGNRNNVDVLQGGNDRSNIVMLGTQGMNIGVLQPANAAPVNLLIARMPNGSIVIK
jgi:hypothetical protein